jgi:hypothetical protein
MYKERNSTTQINNWKYINQSAEIIPVSWYNCEWKLKKLKKELLKEIKHSMQIEIFLKANWCPGNQN